MTEGKRALWKAKAPLTQSAGRNATEYMPMSDTFSPVLHRIDQAVRWRAVHPTEPIPPPYEILTRYSRPPADLVSQSERRLKKLMAAADVKKGMLLKSTVFWRPHAHCIQYHLKCKVGGVIGMKSNHCRVSMSRLFLAGTRRRQGYLPKTLFLISVK